jgi:hypothetical protein
MLRSQRGIQGTVALVLVMLLGSASDAQAAFDGSELEQLLGWLCVVPIGIFQLVAAFGATKHVKGGLVGWTLLAVVLSLAAGLAASLTLERSYLVPVLTIVMLGPGVPIFAASIRGRMFQFAFVLLLVPPLPFILWFWNKVG